MKITLNITAEANSFANIGANEIEEIIRVYRGDIKGYFEDNFKEFVDANDYDFEVEVSFDDFEWKKTKKEYIESIIAAKYRQDYFVFLNNNKLHKSEVDTKNFKEYNVNVFALEKAVNFTAPADTNFRKELEYIHVTPNFIQASDTKKIIRINEKIDIEEDELFVHPALVEILKKGGKFLVNNSIVYVEHKDYIYSTFSALNCKYPYTDRIFKYFSNKYDFKDLKIENINLEEILLTYKDMQEHIYYLDWAIATKTINPEKFCIKGDGSVVFLKDKNIEIGIMPMQKDTKNERNAVNRA